MNKGIIANKNEFDHWFKLNTRWVDMDSMGHINHASYLNYMETARIDYFFHLGLPDIHLNRKNSVILASVKISYHKQSNHPSRFDIGHRVSRVGHKSFDLLTGIFLNDKINPICVATFKMVSFNYEINESIKIPKKINNNYR
ncbi:MAG: acyl-CoA thioesterase [Candidatus Neomarinimicrobiota bacterium]|tara:strand:+ start:191 stop:616 length:426 start_codon:yes stop_codon:yes gene_type:complete